MYEIGDHVMYGMTGACRIKNIRTDQGGSNKDRQYYILAPIQESDSIIMIPIMNKETNMRPVLEKEEAEALLRQLKDETIPWIDDSKERIKEYGELLKTGDPMVWLKLAKALATEKVGKIEDGKKLSSSDDGIYKSAMKLLVGEFSIALDKEFDETEEYIVTFL